MHNSNTLSSSLIRSLYIDTEAHLSIHKLLHTSYLQMQQILGRVKPVLFFGLMSTGY